LDIGVLPPAFSLPPSLTAEPDGEVAVEPRRRGRPRKVAVEAPVES
jgi:D-tyrosyl-tRNA(Tyr) deacylase